MSPLYKPCMFVKGGQISERGDKFPRKYGPREAKFPRKYGPREAKFLGNMAPGRPNFLGNLARGCQIFGGGQISCDTGPALPLDGPGDRILRFERPVPESSMITTIVMDYVYNVHRYHLNSFNQQFLHQKLWKPTTAKLFI